MKNTTYYVSRAGSGGAQTLNVVCPPGYRLALLAARMTHTNGAAATCYVGIKDKNDALIMVYNSQSISNAEALPVPLSYSNLPKADVRLVGEPLWVNDGAYIYCNNSAVDADKLVTITLIYALEPIDSLYIPPT